MEYLFTPTKDKAFYEDNVQTITSMEVAKMVGKEHKNLLADIRKYCEQINGLKVEPVGFDESKIGLIDFFDESTYKDAKGEIRPCYLVTKKGCEFIAHKLTGIKGTQFTAMYINRFHEMEDYIVHDKQIDYSNPFMLCLQGVKFITQDLRLSESSKLYMYNRTFEEFGLPTSFLPKYEDNGNRERCSATVLLKRNECELSTAKFNQKLLEYGFLEEKERPSSSKGVKKFKSLTEKGLEYGVNLICDKNQKETQPYYYADTFMKLYNIVA